MASADGRFHDRDQRRDLQLPGAAPGAGGGGGRLPLAERHRGRARPLRPRRRGHALPAAGDVRPGDLGRRRERRCCSPAIRSASSRSTSRTTGGCLRFASQVKALEAGGAISGATSIPPALAGFLLWGSVPEPLTIRRAVRALPAGSLPAVQDGRIGAPSQYRRCGEPERRPTTLEPAAAVEDSVRAHLVSDVPVAVFLSAGLDSGLIAALARRHLAGAAGDLHPALRRAGRDAPRRGAAGGRGGADAGHPPRRAPGGAGGLRGPLARGAGGHGPAEHRRLQHLSGQPGGRTRRGSRWCSPGLGGDEIFGSYPSFARRARGWSGRRAGRAASPASPRPGPRSRGLAAGRPKLARAAPLRPTPAGRLLPAPRPLPPRGAAGADGPRRRRGGARALRSGGGRRAQAVNGHGAAIPGGRSTSWRRPATCATSSCATRTGPRWPRRSSCACRWWTPGCARAWRRTVSSRPAEHGKAALVRQAAPELPAALFYAAEVGVLHSGDGVAAAGQRAAAAWATSRAGWRYGCSRRSGIGVTP